ncbi:HEAT repeat domain-containing protein [Streptomyces sp. NPDC054841]
MRITHSRDGSGGDPPLEFARFLQRQAREAGLDARKISDRFAQAAEKRKEEEREAAGHTPNGRPEHPISSMSFSKSHIDRLFKAQAAPKPPWPFTLQFLRITSRAAGLTQEEFQRRCREAHELLQAIEATAKVAPVRTPVLPSNAPQGPREETVAALRTEVELERARHTETRLRYALRDTQFLVATLWHIISALREIISSRDVLRARAHHDHANAGDLAGLRDETGRALAHKRTAQDEADRAVARIRTLESLWEQARADVNRLSHFDAADLTHGPNDFALPSKPLLPQDLLAQPALDDVEAALQKAHALNAQQEHTARELQGKLAPPGPLQPDNELAILLAAIRLTDAANRHAALNTLLRSWPRHPDTYDALFHLTHDDNEEIRAAAAQGLADGWGGQDAVHDALLNLSQDDSEHVRAAAARGLAHGWGGQDAVRDALLNLTQDRSKHVQGAAAQGLVVRWGGDDAVRNALPRLVHALSEQVRAATAQGLTWEWRGNTAHAFLRFTQDHSEQVRTAAARGLALVWWGGADIRDALLNLTLDRSKHVRAAAAQALAETWGGQDAIGAALLRLRQDDSAQDRAAVARGLTERWDAVRDALLNLTQDRSKQVRAAAAQGLAERWGGQDAVRDALLNLTQDRSEHVRAAAAQGLAEGWGGQDAVRDALLNLTQDDSEHVRAAAARGLAHGWGGQDAVRDALLNLTQDRSKQVRAAAAGAVQGLAEGWPVSK